MSHPVRFLDLRAEALHTTPAALEYGTTVAAEIPTPDKERGLRDAALWWLDAGYTLIPLNPATTRRRHGNDMDPAKIPNGRLTGSGNGIERIGSADQLDILTWWRAEPHGNIGLNAPRSNVLIIDIDPRHGGWTSFLSWCTEHDIDLDDVPRSLSPTGDGGVHLYWQLPSPYWRQPDHTPTYPFGVFLPGVDRPWQVPAPPSQRLITFTEPGSNRTATGPKPYQWIVGDPRQLPEAPAALLGPSHPDYGRVSTARADGRSTGTTTPAAEGSSNAGDYLDLPRTDHDTIDLEHLDGHAIPGGQQNLAFKNIAAAMLRRHHTDAEILDRLLRLAAASPTTKPEPWTRADLQTVLNKARKFVEKKRREELLAAEARGGKKLTLLERAQLAGLI